ncbi:MAG: hypothetical protein LBP62_07820 [Clostridiales bacterium]|jgi:hypothetical protein|nr:hypothetical protein [Clostridiales bacterium]
MQVKYNKENINLIFLSPYAGTKYAAEGMHFVNQINGKTILLKGGQLEILAIDNAIRKGIEEAEFKRLLQSDCKEAENIFVALVQGGMVE